MFQVLLSNCNSLTSVISLHTFKWIYVYCNILIFKPAVNQETGTSDRRYQDITLAVNGLNSVQFRRPREAGGCQTIYNPVPQIVRVSWNQLVGVWVAVRGSENLLPGNPAEQPSRMRKKCCYSQRKFGSICYSLFRLQLTSHTQPFRNPFEKSVRGIFF